MMIHVTKIGNLVLTVDRTDLTNLDHLCYASILEQEFRKVDGSFFCIFDQFFNTTPAEGEVTGQCREVTVGFSTNWTEGYSFDFRVTQPRVLDLISTSYFVVHKLTSTEQGAKPNPTLVSF